MSARPRLVQEGQPLTEDGGDADAHRSFPPHTNAYPHAPYAPHGGPHPHSYGGEKYFPNPGGRSSFGRGRGFGGGRGLSPRNPRRTFRSYSNPKLTTRLVVGGQEGGDESESSKSQNQGPEQEYGMESAQTHNSFHDANNFKKKMNMSAPNIVTMDHEAYMNYTHNPASYINRAPPHHHQHHYKQPYHPSMANNHRMAYAHPHHGHQYPPSAVPPYAYSSPRGDRRKQFGPPGSKPYVKGFPSDKVTSSCIQTRLVVGKMDEDDPENHAKGEDEKEVDPILSAEEEALENEIRAMEAEAEEADDHHSPDPSAPPDGPRDLPTLGDSVPERMEGVERSDPLGPLVVMDGANIAYAYAKATQQELQSTNEKGYIVPDATGIQVAVEYFLHHPSNYHYDPSARDVGPLRVQAVLPAPWMRLKPRATDNSSDNARMVTPQLELLQDLQAQGLVVLAPPRDDDDAYALTIARREDDKAKQVRAAKQQQEASSSTPSEAAQPPPPLLASGGGGFVVSNDMFRDAAERDGTLQPFLDENRISFTFANLGSYDGYGDPILDFVPNPRHDLIRWMEDTQRQAQEQLLQQQKQQQQQQQEKQE